MPKRHDSVEMPYLRQWRARKLWTQTELGKHAKVSAWTVLRAEDGLPVSILSAQKIANALGMTIKQLQQEPD